MSYRQPLGYNAIKLRQVLSYIEHLYQRTSKAVIFDFDNTLVDCINPKIPQHKHTARQLGIELYDEEILRNWSIHSFSSLLKVLYGGQATLASKLIIEQYDQFPKELYPDTIVWQFDARHDHAITQADFLLK